MTEVENFPPELQQPTPNPQNERVKLAVRGLYDAQKLRIQLQLRIDRLVRDGIMTEDEASSFFNLPFSWFEKAEREMQKLVVAETKDMQIVQKWLLRVRGVGPRLSGLLVANIAPIGRFATKSKLLAYAGLHTIPNCPACDSQLEIPAIEPGSEQEPRRLFRCETCQQDVPPVWRAPRRRKGVKANWNQELKTTAWKLAQSFVKAGGPYRVLYDQYKERIIRRETGKGNVIYTQVNNKWIPSNLELMTDIETPDTIAGLSQQKAPKNPEWTMGRVNNMSLRFVSKLFLSHLWTVWREIEGLPTRPPYEIAYLKHTTYHDPWDFVEPLPIKKKKK